MDGPRHLYNEITRTKLQMPSARPEPGGAAGWAGRGRDCGEAAALVVVHRRTHWCLTPSATRAGRNTVTNSCDETRLDL